MDGWVLKCFYYLVCLFDEMCGLEVVRDGVDGNGMRRSQEPVTGFRRRNDEGAFCLC